MYSITRSISPPLNAGLLMTSLLREQPCSFLSSMVSTQSHMVWTRSSPPTSLTTSRSLPPQVCKTLHSPHISTFCQLTGLRHCIGPTNTVVKRSSYLTLSVSSLQASLWQTVHPTKATCTSLTTSCCQWRKQLSLTWQVSRCINFIFSSPLLP